MTRLFGVLLALALASINLVVAVPATASDAAASCAHRTVLTKYEQAVQFPPYTVQQDVWTQQGKQTMSVCSASRWTATVNQKGTPETGVKTYPDSGKVYTDWAHCSSQPAVGAFTALRSTFAERAPSAGSWDFAYDVFLNGGTCGKPVTEVMVWNQWYQVSVPKAQLHANIDGVAYDVYHSGHYIQVRRVHQVASGAVNLAAVFRYLAQRRLISASDSVQFVQYGVEVLTTQGRNMAFDLTGFSVADRLK